MEIVLKASSIMKTGADILVNSANGALLHGGGTAAEVSAASGLLSGTETNQFNELVLRMPGVVGDAYRKAWSADGGGRIAATKLQLASGKLLMERGGMPFTQGDVILMDGRAIGMKQQIIHAIAMTYKFGAPDDPHTKRSPVIPATPEIVRAVVKKSLEVAFDSQLGQTIAFTVMCARNGGLTPAQSFEAALRGIHESPQASSFKTIFVVGDNQATNPFIASLSSPSSLSVSAGSPSNA